MTMTRSDCSITSTGLDVEDRPLESITVVLQHHTQNQSNHDGNHIANPPKNDNRSLYKRFKEMSPLTFSGTPGSWQAGKWITQLEKIFRVLDCSGEQRVLLAAFTLEGEAEHWWNTSLQMQQVEGMPMTWAEFLEKFNDKYVSEQVRDKKMMKFLNLMQRNRSVEAYEAKFAALSIFAPDMVANEELKAKRFEGGLRPSIRDRIAPFKLTTYAEMVKKAKTIESTTEGGQQIKKKQKAKMMPPNHGPDGINQEKPNKRQRVAAPCELCKKSHGSSPCHKVAGACFKCGEQGHFAKNCHINQQQRPKENAQPPQTQVKVHALSQQNAQASSMVIEEQCNFCKKSHGSSSCPKASGAWFKCGEQAHLVNNYPFKQQQRSSENARPMQIPGKVHALSQQDEQASMTVFEGSLHVSPQNMKINSNPSSKIATLESSNINGASSMNLNMRPPQPPNQQIRVLNGPVAILWDMENCCVPSGVLAEDVACNIRMALRVHPVIKGPVTMFSAYGDFNAFPRRLREGCQRTGVKLIDVPNGRKDAADKAILVDMFLFALDNPPPSSILLISGDVDFAPALHILGQRGYTIILVIPSKGCVSSALSNAGSFVWDWPHVARGEGLVPPKAFMLRQPDVAGHLMGCHLGDTPHAQNDKEAIIYRGVLQNEFSTEANMNKMDSFNSSHISKDILRTSHSLIEYTNNLIGVPCLPSSISHSLPSGLNEVSKDVVFNDLSEAQEQTLWAQSGDIVADTLTVEGEACRKLFCPCSSIHRSDGAGPSAPVSKNKKGVHENTEMVSSSNTVGSSDEFSGDEKVVYAQDARTIETNLGPAQEFNEHLELFRQELQELLVSHSCKILLSSFEPLYEQQYKKTLNYHIFGVDELEELIGKVRDVVALHEVQGSKNKFILANCLNG